MNEKEDPVYRENSLMIAGIAFIVVFFLIVISVYTVATGNVKLDHPDKWYVYIYEFQTLIGGLLAVGAAFMTIRQMRKSDERADDRHDALMRLQLRDTIEGVRTLYANHGHLLHRCDTYLYANARFLTIFMEKPPSQEISNQRIHETVVLLEELVECLNNNDWDEYKASIDSETRAAHSRLMKLIDRARDNSILQLRGRGAAGEPIYVQITDNNLGQVHDLAIDLKAVCREISSLLKGLHVQH